MTSVRLALTGAQRCDVDLVESVPGPRPSRSRRLVRSGDCYVQRRPFAAPSTSLGAA